MDARTAPPRELVHAYMLTFGGEGGKAVMADLVTFVERNMASQKDKLDRVDPYQVVAQLAAERLLKRIQSLAAMAKNPEWLEIDRQRQMAAAQQKER